MSGYEVTKAIISQLIILALVLSIFCGVFPASVHAYSGGDGSAGNPFQISTVADLEQLRTDANNGATAGKYYKLMNDIDLSSIAHWGTIGEFKGNFDGNYHVISHVTIGTAGSPDTGLVNLGLFGVNRGTISRLGVTDVVIYSSRNDTTYLGGLAGMNDGLIASCYSTGSVNGGDSSIETSFIIAGGLVGFNYTHGNIENCYSTAGASGGDCTDDYTHVYIGGLVGGIHSGELINCYATGDVSGGSGEGDVEVGGIVGNVNGPISYAYWNSDAAQTVGGTPQVPKKGIGGGSLADISIAKTSAEMKSADFVSLLNAHRGANSGWLIVPGKNDGYPILGCTVTFNSNGGSAVDPAITDRDTTISEPSEPTKAGCTFDGWYKDAGLTTPWNFATDTVTTDITLYAGWIATPPTVTTEAATDVAATTATLNSNITAINDTSITERGFDWDTDSGEPYANSWTETGSWSTGTFNHGISSLPSGTTIYFRAKAKNNNDAWGYGSERSFLTKPAAPADVQATDGTETTKVTITWTKSTGATDYQVYRDGAGLGWLGDVDSYDDSGAGAPSINAGTAAATDGSSTAQVSLTLSGASASNGTTHTYKVRAKNATGESVDSSTDTGYRGTTALAYQWQRSAADSDADYSDISGATTATHDDTGAPAPTITAGTAAASDGTYSDKVVLSLSGESANPGDGRYYRCIVSMPGATSQNSASDRGYRGVGALTYQWQRSAADSDADYSDISGATTDPYDDTDGATEPDGRYYKCRLNATGASEQISGADRGYKAALVSPTVTTEAASGIGANSATLNMSYTVGDYGPVDVRFGYKKSADADWTYTGWVSKSADGTHAELLTGLDFDTQYDFKAQLKYNHEIEGDTLQFTTLRINTASVASATGTGTVTFTTSDGSVTELTAMAEGTLPTAGKPAGVTFPHGFFSYNIVSITPGSTVTITITLPSAMPVGTQYWKCINSQWVDVTSLLGDDDGDNVLTLTLTDGGLGDADGVANGTIADPGGPGVPAPAAPEPAPIPIPPKPRASATPSRLLNPAQISTRYLNISPQQTSAGQPVTITTNVVNTGDEAGNYNVTLKINGQAEQTKMGSVGPQVAQPVKFTVTKAQPGTYTVDIGGQKGSFIILGADSRSAGGLGEGLLLVAATAVIVILLGLLIIVARRRIQGC